MGPVCPVWLYVHVSPVDRGRPSCPLWLYPNACAAPTASMTTVCQHPALALVTKVSFSPNPSTRVGLGSKSLSSSSDSKLSSCRAYPTLGLPSWPCRLLPHVHSFPHVSTQTTCASPRETPVTLTDDETDDEILSLNRTTRGACRTLRVTLGVFVNWLAAVRVSGSSSSSDWPPSPSMPWPTSTPHVHSFPIASTLHATSAPIASVASGLWHLRWTALHDSAPRGGAVGSAQCGFTRCGRDERTADSEADSARLLAPTPIAGLAATSTAARSRGERRPLAAARVTARRRASPSPTDIAGASSSGAIPCVRRPRCYLSRLAFWSLVSATARFGFWRGVLRSARTSRNARRPTPARQTQQNTPCPPRKRPSRCVISPPPSSAPPASPIADPARRRKSGGCPRVFFPFESARRSPRPTHPS